MSTTTIFDWMSDIPGEHQQEPQQEPAFTPVPKRRRLNLVTPSESHNSNDDKNIVAMSRKLDESPTKRRIPVDDEAPRPPDRKRIHTPNSESSYSRSEQSDRSFLSSRHSGKLSPQKHLQILKINPHGIKFRDLVQFDDKPPSLEELLKMVDVIMEGKGIISSSARVMLERAAQSHKDFRWGLRGGHYFSNDRDKVGPTPSPKDVLDVVDAAAECSSYGHPETNWNLEVHQRVLELAFRPNGKPRFKHLVNFMGSTTASIIPSYGSPALSKKVDFCIYIEPENASSDPSTTSIQSAIACLRDTLPGRALNHTDFAPLDQRPIALSIETKKHTDFAPLDQRPIALSIETKKPSEGFGSAKLQLGVWQMAHWAFLRHLTENRNSS